MQTGQGVAERPVMRQTVTVAAIERVDSRWQTITISALYILHCVGAGWTSLQWHACTITDQSSEEDEMLNLSLF